MTITTQSRPQRWDQPFGSEMTDADVERLLGVPEIQAIEADKFPSRISLAGILRNDARIMSYKAGDIVIREGDYGNSAFLVLNGSLRVVLAPGLPGEMLGRRKIQKKNFWQALKQLWTQKTSPEFRDIQRYDHKSGLRESAVPGSSHVFLQDVPAVLDSNKTAVLEGGALFGELAALGRTPRTSTIFAETDSELLEIRWQGLRELRKYDQGWRRLIDQRYRQNALKAHLGATSIFSHLDDDDLQEVADNTLFETYGTFDWHLSYKKLQEQDRIDGVKDEPEIAQQGAYPDGILMVRAGFARVSVERGNGRQTITYLGAGEFYGADEIYRAWKGELEVGLKVTISALGYVEVLRVPSKTIEKHLFAYWESDRQGGTRDGKIEPGKRSGRIHDFFDQTLAEGALQEWAVQERFVNGTQAMLINLDKCVRCDDCVRACASTHDGNPRFVRHGKTFQNWMVANACMHCADPVCMIGCPTGAIHRSLSGGMVIINDDTCIGCETCANSCPYSNIRMVSINDENGQHILDPQNHKPIVKATKCDLCADQITGPACAFACPHDALKRVDFRDVTWTGDVGGQ
ncbi:MAG: cyclic nucleotide-binding domain-containing protein [Nitrospinaceae bacterium]|nr:cyclic nucleotide-binding domain-containing protein [Nitrospinaceae bacterium]